MVEQHALLTDSQLTAFLALSQVTPGPLGFYLLFVGYSVSGAIGALLAWLAILLPALLVMPILHVLERRKHVQWINGAADESDCRVGGIFKPRICRWPLSITTVPVKEGYRRKYDDAFGLDGLLRYRYRGVDPNHPDNTRLRESMRLRLPRIYFHGIVEGRYEAEYPVFVVGDLRVCSRTPATRRRDAQAPPSSEGLWS